ncbi:MAG: DUF4112 domain-containing protein [Pyrinomonadaceae bacterium]
MRELQRKTPPAGATERRRPSQVEVERSLDQLAHLMDGLFRIPGTGWRFGLDALVGLIPGVGDTATTVVSFYLLAAGVRYRVPKVTLLRMGLNVALDYLFGAIPFVGDLFDAAWKSNRKNLELIRERATVSAGEARQGRISDWLFVGLIMLALVLLLVGSITVAWYILSLIFRGIPSP